MAIKNNEVRIPSNVAKVLSATTKEIITHEEDTALTKVFESRGINLKNGKHASNFSIIARIPEVTSYETFTDHCRLNELEGIEQEISKALNKPRKARVRLEAKKDLIHIIVSL